MRGWLALVGAFLRHSINLSLLGCDHLSITLALLSIVGWLTACRQHQLTTCYWRSGIYGHLIAGITCSTMNPLLVGK